MRWSRSSRRPSSAGVADSVLADRVSAGAVLADAVAADILPVHLLIYQEAPLLVTDAGRAWRARARCSASRPAPYLTATARPGPGRAYRVGRLTGSHGRPGWPGRARRG